METTTNQRKKYYDERLAVDKEKVEQMKRRNRLISERNVILKEKKCICHDVYVRVCQIKCSFWYVVIFKCFMVLKDLYIECKLYS